MLSPARAMSLLTLALLGACAGSTTPGPAAPVPPPGAGNLPPIPPPAGPLDIRVVYPGPNDLTLHMSNHEVDILVHKLRAEHMAILVGGATSLNDDSQLTTRLWPGNNPLRIIWDTRGDLPARLRVFDGTVPTWVFTTVKHAQYPNAAMYHFPEGKAPLLAIVAQMRASGIQSVLVEGGALTHKTFLQTGLSDQLVRIQTPFVAGEGVAVPDAEGLEKLSYRVQQVGDNRILHAENPRGTFTL